MNKERYNGDMHTGLMCLGCGRITGASTMFWGVVYEPRENNVPLVRMCCPECSHINPVNVNYMVVE